MLRTGTESILCPNFSGNCIPLVKWNYKIVDTSQHVRFRDMNIPPRLSRNILTVYDSL